MAVGDIPYELDFPRSDNVAADSIRFLPFELGPKNNENVLNAHLCADHSGQGTGVPEHDIGQAEALGFSLQVFVDRVCQRLLPNRSFEQGLVDSLLRTLKRIQKGIDRKLIPHTQIPWEQLIAAGYPSPDAIHYSFELHSDGVTYDRILAMALRKTTVIDDQGKELKVTGGTRKKRQGRLIRLKRSGPPTRTH